jgi:hypothetical protein
MSSTTPPKKTTEEISTQQLALKRVSIDDTEFMGIKLRHWPEDRIFNLFLKYKINGIDSGIKFINTYLTTMPNSTANSYRKKDKDLGIDFVDMETNKNEMFTKFVDGWDFVTRVEKVYTATDIATALRDYFMKNTDKASTRVTKSLPLDQNTFMRDYNSSNKIYYYVTIPGLLKAYEIMDSSNIPENMKTEINKIIMWAAVMTDTKNGENIYGTV